MLGLLLGAGMVVAVSAGVVLLVAVVRRHLRGRPILTLEPRRQVPWGLVDILLLLVLLGLAASISASVINAQSGTSAAGSAAPTVANDSVREVAIGALATLAVMLISALFIAVRCRASLVDFGIVPRKLAADVRLGIGAFLLLAPPVYALQLLLVQWVKSQHPLIERMREDPDPYLIAASIFSAVLVAPLVEEYAFRVLIQGWLEKFSGQRGDPLELLLGTRLPSSRRPADNPKPSAVDTQWDAKVERAGTISPDGRGAAPEIEDNPYSPPRSTDKLGAGLEIGRAGGGSQAVAAWPIFVSAALFAGMHVSHGPDWIPLLLLAIGLGYLYRQTHRIVPCIVVHFLLNAVSMGLFLLEVFA